MTRTPLPSAVSGANTHRIVLHQPDTAVADADRMQDILADGLGKLRMALAAMETLPGDLVLSLDAAERALRAAFDKRRLLSDLCRHAIQRWLDDAGRRMRNRETEPTVEHVRQLLDGALAASDRVLDLLAAERDLHWHRDQAR